MVEGNGDLHVLVFCIRIAVAQEHDLVMVSHEIVRDGYGGGSMDGINEAVMAVGQRAMVNPYMPPTEDGHPITIRYSPPAGVVRRVSDVGIPSLLTVMDMETMYDDVTGVMDGNAWPSSNVNASTPTINCLERVHHQLLLQLDDHVTLEDDPQWLILDHSMTESPWPWIDRVIVLGVGDHVNSTILSAHCILAKPNSAVG